MPVPQDQTPEWKLSVVENNYSNVKALAELTEEVASHLDYLIDLYDDRCIDSERLENTMNQGKRIIEAEKALRPREESGVLEKRGEKPDSDPEEEVCEAVSELTAEDESYEAQLLWAQGAYMSALDGIRELEDVDVLEPEFYQ